MECHPSFDLRVKIAGWIAWNQYDIEQLHISPPSANCLPHQRGDSVNDPIGTSKEDELRNDDDEMIIRWNTMEV